MFGKCIALLSLLLATSSSLVSAADVHPRGVSAAVIVNAKPNTIYAAIRGLRDEPDSDVKELSKDVSHSVLEEKFCGLPIIGQAVCVYEEKYQPSSRIDYHMLRSDKFKAFEGAWVLTPVSGHSTRVELRHYVDTGLRFPFARQLTDAQTTKDIKERLQEVKAKSECQ